VSRVGKQPIKIPDGVSVSVEDGIFTAKIGGAIVGFPSSTWQLAHNFASRDSPFASARALVVKNNKLNAKYE